MVSLRVRHTDGPQKSKKIPRFVTCHCRILSDLGMIFLYPEEMGMMATLQRQLDKDETTKQS